MRRFKTDYAGFWSGYCNTRESAIIAAMKRLVLDHCTSATIIDRETDQDVARVRLSADRHKATVTVMKPFEE